jgi:hypothetical protein
MSDDKLAFEHAGYLVHLVMAPKTWIKLVDDCEGAESWQKNKIK